MVKIINLERKGWNIKPYRRDALKQYVSSYNQDNLTVLADTAVKEIVERQGFHFEPQPRSIYRVGKLYDALGTFSPSNAPYVKYDDSLRSGISLAWKCFGRPHTSAFIQALELTPSAVVRMTSNPNGSSGLTAFGTRKKNAQVRALERAIQIVHGDKSPEPCIAFKRTQKNDKTRLVWGFPYSMTVLEGLIAHPLNETFKKVVTPMAYAMTSMLIGARIRTSSRRNKFCYSLDMSQFDASIASYLINVSFDIIGSWFDLDAIEPISGVTYGHILHVVRNYFVTTPIVMPDGNIYTGKKHGVPSGSYFTQIVDSIVNTILCGAVSHRFKLGTNRRDIMVLGDDLLFFSDRKVSLNAISEFAKRNLGINVHGSEKSEIYDRGDTIHFLGRYWSNGNPDLPVSEVVAKMVYPESYRHYAKDPKVRARQVRLLMASYASVYKSAWRILEREVNPEYRNTARGELPIDVAVYLSRMEGEFREIDPTMLSGLARYRFTYLRDKDQRNQQSPYSGGQYLR